MATVAEMQTQLDVLRKARASGVRKTEYGEKSVEYKSDEEMAAAIADIERRITGASGRPIRTVYFNSTKGL